MAYASSKNAASSPSATSLMKSQLEAMTKEALIEMMLGMGDLATLREQVAQFERKVKASNLRLAIKEKQLRELAAEQSWSSPPDEDHQMMDHAVGSVFTAIRSELRSNLKETRALKLDPLATRSQKLSALTNKLSAQCKILEEEVARSTERKHKLARSKTILAFTQKADNELKRKQRELDDMMAQQEEEMNRFQAQLMGFQNGLIKTWEENDSAIQQFCNSPFLPNSRPDSANQQRMSSLGHSISDVKEENAEREEIGQSQEMEMISSPEGSENGEPEANKEDMEEDIIVVSSPEPEEISMVSSPETNVLSGVISDESD